MWRLVACLILLPIGTLATSSIGISAPPEATARQRAWALFASAVTPTAKNPEPAFTRWFNAADVFTPAPRLRETPGLPFPGLPIGGGAVREARNTHEADAPIVTFVHYNSAAYRHIRMYGLYRADRLQDLSRDGALDPDIPGLRTIPDFPRDAAVMMTVWWPLVPGEINPLPVWDEAGGDARNYTEWRRIVAISSAARPRPVRDIEFAGQTFVAPTPVSAARFFQIPIDAALAARLNGDTGARKAVAIVLGRPFRAGDRLALVGMHLLSMETRLGLWSTFWWHDRPNAGRFAQGQPQLPDGDWRNYVMDVAIDAVEPREPDGSPAISFNPWFEAKFPDGGHGNGTQSNCVTCHNRASWPRTDFLPITRGAPDLRGDPAFAAGRLRTGRLWSLGNLGVTAGNEAAPRP